jgi:hypothetical protein
MTDTFRIALKNLRINSSLNPISSPKKSFFPRISFQRLFCKTAFGFFKAPLSQPSFYSNEAVHEKRTKTPTTFSLSRYTSPT